MRDRMLKHENSKRCVYLLHKSLTTSSFPLRQAQCKGVAAYLASPADNEPPWFRYRVRLSISPLSAALCGSMRLHAMKSKQSVPLRATAWRCKCCSRCSERKAVGRSSCASDISLQPKQPVHQILALFLIIIDRHNGHPRKDQGG
jgi:hypothetical protein